MQNQISLWTAHRLELPGHKRPIDCYISSNKNIYLSFKQLAKDLALSYDYLQAKWETSGAELFTILKGNEVFDVGCTLRDYTTFIRYFATIADNVYAKNIMYEMGRTALFFLAEAASNQKLAYFKIFDIPMHISRVQNEHRVNIADLAELTHREPKDLLKLLESDIIVRKIKLRNQEVDFVKVY